MMTKPLSRMSRRELVAVTSDRYRESAAAERRIILSEFVALTGYHRKHAIRLLNQTAVLRESSRRRGGRRVYDDAVRDALVVLWEAADRVCGKRLHAVIRILIPALEQHGHLQLDAQVRGQVLAASPATIDRLLSPIRTAARGGPARRRVSTTPMRRPCGSGRSPTGTRPRLASSRRTWSRTRAAIRRAASCRRSC